MGSISVFARVEKKYMLTGRQALDVRDALAVRGFAQGIYGRSLIQSLYYDTPDWLLTRCSIERPVYKEKLRFRSYGTAADSKSSFVEIKKKYRGVVYKRRIELPCLQAEASLAAGRMPDSAGQIGREITYMMQRYGLCPQALILYDRDAFTSEREVDVRITFDRSIRYRTWETDMRLPAFGIPLLGEDEVLMEVKVPGAYPLWLLNILESVKAMPVHFSKIGEAYRRETNRRVIDVPQRERGVLYSA